MTDTSQAFSERLRGWIISAYDPDLPETSDSESNAGEFTKSDLESALKKVSRRSPSSPVK